MRRLRNIGRDDKGATAVEYGLILALVFLAMVVAVYGFAQANSDIWNRVSNEVTS